VRGYCSGDCQIQIKEDNVTNEPDYTLTIIQEDGGWVVCEGGVSISRRFEKLTDAGWWFEQHRMWHQPCCCVCGSPITRPDDPWVAYQVSCSSGADYMHQSCMEKFEAWTDDEKDRPDRDPGPHLIPNMDVLDAAWRKKAKN
jgi:hypothetical protein